VLFVVHNFSDKSQALDVDVKDAGGPELVDLLATNDSRANAQGRHLIPLEPHGYRWYRAVKRT
jgi:maltose alpha-D-glucosyltransferase/alpha-amylase